jgi:tripartite-type tricarboxylate transporter receptor subunit TctC
MKLLPALAALAATLAPLAVAAQDFPTRPVKLVLPFAAGGISDVMGRLVAQEMQKALGQPIVAENRVGAGSALGTDAVAKAAPDGYTMCFCGNAAITLLPHMNQTVPYDPLKDLKPIGSTYTVDLFFIVRKDFPASTLPEFIAAAKAKPGTLSYGSNGPGSSAHLSGAMLTSMAGIDLIHVPYKGEQPATTDLLGGQLSLGIVSTAGTQAQRNAGTIKVLANASRQRSSIIPDVPTVAEQGYPAYESPLWNIIMVPGATPAGPTEKLRAALIAAMKNADVQTRMLAAGVNPVAEQPSIESMQRQISSEHERWGKLIKQLDLGSKG